uniref:uncharacterized protein LOC120331190 n=1 Tax=Styela clava TaxID=7725 RepID=UPI001939E761|nr:uncharacterized protein LOC120331190 [Styela clava]
MGRKTSIVWNHFTIPELYPKKALCNYCHQLVCRGQANLGTTSLMNHLKRCNEFKVAVLGLPMGSGLNDMMADIMAQDGQNNSLSMRENNEEVLHIEPQPVSDEENSSSAPTTTDNNVNNLLRASPAQINAFVRRMSNSPSLVGRQNWTSSSTSRENTQPATHNYQSPKSGRRSMLLYGDISSTSEEEPSSSNACYSENPLITSSSNDLNNYIAGESTVNFVHGGLVLHMLYEQYKTGKFCDLHIIPQKSVNEVTILESGKVSHKNLSTDKKCKKISVHSCLLTAMSKKISTLVEMGCTSVKLRKGSSDAVKGVIEIVYTGKLEKIRVYTEAQLTEILDVARFLEVDLVVQYLMREIPECKTRQKPKHIAQRELYNEAMLAFSHIQRGYSFPSSTSNINHMNTAGNAAFNEAFLALQRDEMRHEQESQDGSRSHSASDTEGNDYDKSKHVKSRSQPSRRSSQKSSKDSNHQRMVDIMDRVSEQVPVKRPKREYHDGENSYPSLSPPPMDKDSVNSPIQDSNEPLESLDTSDSSAQAFEQRKSSSPSEHFESKIRYKFHPLRSPDDNS